MHFTFLEKFKPRDNYRISLVSLLQIFFLETTRNYGISICLVQWRIVLRGFDCICKYIYTRTLLHCCQIEMSFDSNRTSVKVWQASPRFEKLIVFVNSKRATSWTEFRQRLHWLPVSHRCQFKIRLFTFRILQGQAPGYLCDLATRVEPRRVTRSAAELRVQVPRYSQEF